MGDWEDFCADNGQSLDWEPWNSRSWNDDETTSRLSRKKRYYEYESFCTSVNDMIEKVIKQYSSNLTVSAYFKKQSALSTFVIKHNVNNTRDVQYLFEFEGIDRALPLHLRKILRLIRKGSWSYWEDLIYQNRYNLSCKVIHDSKSFKIIKFDKINTSELTKHKFHCDKGSMCG